MRGGEWIKEGARRWVRKRLDHWYGQASVARCGVMSPVSMPPVAVGVTGADVIAEAGAMEAGSTDAEAAALAASLFSRVSEPGVSSASLVDPRAAVMTAAPDAWAPCELNDLDSRALSFVLTIVERLEAEGYAHYALAVLSEIDGHRLPRGHREAFDRLRGAIATSEQDGACGPSRVAPTRAR
ncbi:MAG: hypothetical protein H6729_16305 [Deltaproteobacteria bacterium]|nr:hypothetical protein [Deltaproteobacteria bacterium]